MDQAASPPARHGHDASALNLLNELIYQCAHAPYRHQYAFVLRGHPEPKRVLCELFLFRLWLTWAGFGHAHPDHPALGSYGNATLASRASEARGAFELHHHVRLGTQLDDDWEALVGDRFAAYDRFFPPRATLPEPVNFELVSIALGHRLCDAANPVLTAQLALAASRQYAELRLVYAAD